MTDRRLTLAAAALALLGVAIAGYLTWVHYAELEPFCVGGGAACERVQSSRYADLAGVPVALLGLAGYLAILGALALPGSAGRSATAFVALVGAGFSVYLTYVEVAVLEAICQWCVASAVVVTLIAGVTVARMVTADMNLHSTGT
jgi:uncharacterized membrane protein